MRTFVQTGTIARMKRVITALLLLVAALCTLVGVAIPFGLATQARQDRAYYEQFRRAGAFVAAFERQHGYPPADAALGKAISLSPVDDLHSLPPTAPTLCDGSFRTTSRDRLVLWFWRGEWAECFAYPSGRTTLPMTVASYLHGNLGLLLLLDWLLVIVALAAVFRPRQPRQRKVARAAE